MSNIYLIGMRGVGKTTVARLLANKLDKPHHDLDQDIAHQEGMAISEMVKEQGWEYFRQRELEAVDRITAVQEAVVSTGGGVLMFFDNADKLKASGIFVFLTAEPESLYQRLADSMKDRPALKEGDLRDEIEQLWEERKEVYHQYADITIETDNETPAAIVERIIQMLNPDDL